MLKLVSVLIISMASDVHKPQRTRLENTRTPFHSCYLHIGPSNDCLIFIVGRRNG